MHLVIDGIVATITAHVYIIGINGLGLFFRSHINEPNAASDILKTWNIWVEKLYEKVRTYETKLNSLNL